MKRVLFTLACTGLLGMVSAKEEKRLVLREGWDDLPARDYSHIYMEVLDVKPEQNGLPELARIAEVLSGKYPKFVGMKPKVGEYSQFKSTKEVEALYDKIYREIQPVYLEIDKALEKPYLIEKNDFSIEASANKTIRMISLSRYLSFRSCKLADAGKRVEAMKAFDQQLLLTKKLRSQSKTLVGMLVNAALESVQIQTADYLLEKMGDSEQFRKSIFSRLRKPVDYQKETSVAMQSEIFVIYKIVDSFATGHLGILDGEDYNGLNKISLWDAYFGPNMKKAREKRQLHQYRYVANLVFQPNKTMDFFYQNYLLQRKMIAMSPSELAHFSQDSEKSKETSKQLKIKLDSNLLGRTLLNLSSSIINKQIVRAYAIPQAVNLLEARHALKRYRKDHGKLPTKLSKLVPDYLAKVPVDIFTKDQAEIQYDVKKEMVWSIGSDGRDDFNVSELTNAEVYQKGDNVAGGIHAIQPRFFVD